MLRNKMSSNTSRVVVLTPEKRKLTLGALHHCPVQQKYLKSVSQVLLVFKSVSQKTDVLNTWKVLKQFLEEMFCCSLYESQTMCIIFYIIVLLPPCGATKIKVKPFLPVVGLAQANPNYSSPLNILIFSHSNRNIVF